jgi:penicillin-binding protein 2
MRTRLSDEEVARFTAQRYRFPGVEIKARLFRQYPNGDVASHVLGYIGRINQREKAAMEDWGRRGHRQLPGTDYIGKLGRRAELRKRAARPDRRRADGNLGRRSRGALARQPPGHAGQHDGAVDRHQAAEVGGRHVR